MKNYFKEQKWNDCADITVRKTHARDRGVLPGVCAPASSSDPGRTARWPARCGLLVPAGGRGPCPSPVRTPRGHPLHCLSPSARSLGLV